MSDSVLSSGAGLPQVDGFEIVREPDGVWLGYELYDDDPGGYWWAKCQVGDWQGDSVGSSFGTLMDAAERHRRDHADEPHDRRPGGFWAICRDCGKTAYAGDVVGLEVLMAAAVRHRRGEHVDVSLVLPGVDGLREGVLRPGSSGAATVRIQPYAAMMAGDEVQMFWWPYRGASFAVMIEITEKKVGKPLLVGVPPRSVSAGVVGPVRVKYVVIDGDDDARVSPVLAFAVDRPT